MNPIFQFHKGTIRTPSIKSIIKFISNFNSIKVQLEPKEGATDYAYIWDFNSIKVQLEPKKKKKKKKK